MDSHIASVVLAPRGGTQLATEYSNETGYHSSGGCACRSYVCTLGQGRQSAGHAVAAHAYAARSIQLLAAAAVGAGCRPQRADARPCANVQWLWLYRHMAQYSQSGASYATTLDDATGDS